MRYFVGLVVGLLVIGGSCYCDDAAVVPAGDPVIAASEVAAPNESVDAVSILNEIEASSDIDSSELIDDDVLNALEELDQTQDMNMSFKQKLWLFYVYLSMQTEKAKTHVSDHKKEYIIGASVLAAAVLVIIVYRKLHAPAAPAA